MLVKKACKEYDKGAACFTMAARVGIPFAGSPGERTQSKAIDCGFAAPGKAGIASARTQENKGMGDRKQKQADDTVLGGPQATAPFPERRSHWMLRLCSGQSWLFEAQSPVHVLDHAAHDEAVAALGDDALDRAANLHGSLHRRRAAVDPGVGGLIPHPRLEARDDLIDHKNRRRVCFQFVLNARCSHLYLVTVTRRVLVRPRSRRCTRRSPPTVLIPSGQATPPMRRRRVPFLQVASELVFDRAGSMVHVPALPVTLAA